MKRRGVIHTLTGLELHNDGNVRELTMQEMYRKFISEPMLSFDEFKEFVEEYPNEMFDGAVLQADIRIVTGSEWSELAFKAKQYNKLIKELENNENRNN